MNKKLENFNVFGSKSSLDRDIIVFLDKIPSLEDCKKLSLELNPILEELFNDDKKANSNFGVVKNGILTEVFKGTVDEVNNSLLETYGLHKQLRPLLIESHLPRNKEQKLLRVARIILSFFSRTEYREIVKNALRNDLKEKILTLEKIDFSKSYDFNKNGSAPDVYKNIAFQFGQILGLYDNLELYTKEDISSSYPLLHNFLYRKPLTQENFQSLELFKKEFVNLCKEELPNLSKLIE